MGLHGKAWCVGGPLCQSTRATTGVGEDLYSHTLAESQAMIVDFGLGRANLAVGGVEIRFPIYGFARLLVTTQT